MIPVKVATVAGAAELEAELTEMLGRSRKVELFMRCMDRTEILAVIRAGGIDAVVIAGAAPWFDAQCRDEAATAGIKVLGLARDPLDAEEFARQDLPTLRDGTVDEILERIRSVDDPAVHADREPPGTGRVIAVWGPKGAPGRTTVATELAYALSYQEPSTLLLDGDPYGGDIKQSLGIVEEIATVLWAARMASKGTLTVEVLREELRRVGPAGPIVLPGLPRSDLWAEISEHGWQQLLSLSREHFSRIVADVGFCIEGETGAAFVETSGGRNRMARTALQISDTVVVVFKADPVGIKNLCWSLEALNEVVEPSRCILVANQVVAGEGADVAEAVKRSTGRQVAVQVPFEPADLAFAVRQGRSLSEVRPGSSVVSAVRELSNRICAPKRSSGFLSRLGGRG